MMKPLTLRLAALAGAALLAACAAAPGGKTTSTAEQRAAQRWQLLIQGKAAEAYDFLSPGVRSAKPRDQYAAEMSDRPVKWKSVEVRDSRCEAADRCEVHVVVTYTANLPLRGVGAVESPAVLSEKWIAIDGVWYHLPAEYVKGKGLR